MVVSFSFVRLPVNFAFVSLTFPSRSNGTHTDNTTLLSTVHLIFQFPTLHSLYPLHPSSPPTYESQQTKSYTFERQLQTINAPLFEAAPFIDA